MTHCITLNKLHVLWEVELNKDCGKKKKKKVFQKVYSG